MQDSHLGNYSWIAAVVVKCLERVKEHDDELGHLHASQVSKQDSWYSITPSWPTHFFHHKYFCISGPKVARK